MNDWNGNRRAVFVTNGDTSHSAGDAEIILRLAAGGEFIEGETE